MHHTIAPPVMDGVVMMRFVALFSVIVVEVVGFPNRSLNSRSIIHTTGQVSAAVLGKLLSKLSSFRAVPTDLEPLI